MRPRDWELNDVLPEDDTGDDRLIFGFGQKCPLELKPGVDLCTSYKKHGCCTSVVSETLARNYLFQHAFHSSNHPTYKDIDAAWVAAQSAELVMGTETLADREARRKGCHYDDDGQDDYSCAPNDDQDDDNQDTHGSNDDNSEPTKRRLERERERSRSDRTGKDATDSGRATASWSRRARTHGDGRGRASGAARQPANGRGRASGVHPVYESAPAEASGVATSDSSATTPPRIAAVSVEQLRVLEKHLANTIEAQKRRIDGIQTFSKLMEDECHGFCDVKKSVTEALFMRAGCSGA